MMKDKKPENDKIQFTIPITRRALKYAILLLLAAALIYAVVVTPEKIGGMISATVSLLSPFIIGLCLAYVVNLLLRPIERFWLFCWKKLKNKKVILALKRPVCIIVSYVVVFGIVFAIVFMIIPAFKSAAVEFINSVPGYVDTIEKAYHSTVGFFERYRFDLPEITLDSTKITDIGTNLLAKYGDTVITTTVTVTASIVSGIVNMFLGIIFSVYILCQKETLCRQAKKIVKALFVPERAEKVLDFAAITNKAFTKFVTGQLAEVCIIGTLCFAGMLVFDMPYAAIVSLLVGFTALIPILGAFIGTGIGAVLILLEDPIKAFWFVVFIIIIQQIDNNLIYPRVVGKSVGLPGIWVLTAVTIGGGAFGVLGMLFSVPICSVMYVLFRRYVNRKNAELEAEEYGPQEAEADDTEEFSAE